MSTLMPSAAVAPYAIAPYSDAWRAQYGKSRYLQFLSNDGLQQRYVDLLDNVLVFEPDGRPQFVGLDIDTGITRRIADLRAEVDLRQLESEWLVSVEQSVLQKPYPQVARAIEVWGNRRWTPESCLIKYGKRKYMAALVERGCIRLTPASCYKDPSLNPAIQDSELNFAVHFPPGTKAWS
jgi:hypothetical protein